MHSAERSRGVGSNPSVSATKVLVRGYFLTDLGRSANILRTVSVRRWVAPSGLLALPMVRETPDQAAILADSDQFGTEGLRTSPLGVMRRPLTPGCSACRRRCLASSARGRGCEPECCAVQLRLAGIVRRFSYGAATILIDAGAPLSRERPVLPRAVGCR